jgi:hypothetical protein
VFTGYKYSANIWPLNLHANKRFILAKGDLLGIILITPIVHCLIAAKIKNRKRKITYTISIWNSFAVLCRGGPATFECRLLVFVTVQDFTSHLFNLPRLCKDL